MAFVPTVAPLASDGDKTGALTQVSVLGLAESRDAWRHLQNTGVATPNHRYEWLEVWQRHLGRRMGLEPAVVVGRDATDAPLMLWPLGVRRVAGTRVASWLGGRFANYQTGLYAPHAPALLTRADMARALVALRDARKVDAVHLVNQPVEWLGLPNPFLQLPHQPAPSQAYSLSIGGRGFEEILLEQRSRPSRRKLRRAERKLAETFGGCAMRRPATRSEVDAVLDVFLHQKRRRLAQSGIPNRFDAPGIGDFLRELGRSSLGCERPLLDIYWLQCGDQIGATWAGVRDRRRLSGMISSFDPGEMAVHHPGEVLLRHVVEHACESGIEIFDLGAGDAPYKLSWCPNVDPLFESHLALTGRGAAYAAVSSLLARAKTRLKRSPRAMAALYRLGMG